MANNITYIEREVINFATAFNKINKKKEVFNFALSK
jgi:hypothetical protein